MPTATDRVRSDLSYVRKAVESSDRHPTPASIYLLWAAIGAVGFPILDLAPRYAPWFWLIASPLGLAVSLWLGRRHARRIGQIGRSEGRRHGLHWLGVVLAAALAMLLAVAGRVDGAVLGQVVLLLIALTYFLAGVHLDRAMLWVSGLLVAGYLALFVVAAWAWTVIGLTLAAGLAACAAAGRRGLVRRAG
jgi:hypothetical protein